MFQYINTSFIYNNIYFLTLCIKHDIFFAYIYFILLKIKFHFHSEVCRNAFWDCSEHMQPYCYARQDILLDLGNFSLIKLKVAVH